MPPATKPAMPDAKKGITLALSLTSLLPTPAAKLSAEITVRFAYSESKSPLEILSVHERPAGKLLKIFFGLGESSLRGMVCIMYCAKLWHLIIASCCSSSVGWRSGPMLIPVWMAPQHAGVMVVTFGISQVTPNFPCWTWRPHPDSPDGVIVSVQARPLGRALTTRSNRFSGSFGIGP